MLKESATGELAGIAWTGPGTSPHIPGGKLTGGVRLSEHFQGLGLATPFLTVVLEYTRHEYSSDLLWFESWQSNAGAIHIYQKLGFQIIKTEPGQRPTTTGDTTPDTRLYMKLA
ncbi:GNAT family N-acetyltransferase [Candidatus Saccharibacteria bacterium]|nr:MAG: GNAT family N-acetyltransferase [Candidatus Saccharibacteria bacterium]